MLVLQRFSHFLPVSENPQKTTPVIFHKGQRPCDAGGRLLGRFWSRGGDSMMIDWLGDFTWMEGIASLKLT